MRPIYNYLIILLLIFYHTTTTAADLYNENFDHAGAMPSITPNPVLSLTDNILKFYGPGNSFVVTDATAHSGEYSLRFSYEGRNGFCNTCGINFAYQKKGLDEALFFVAESGKDLTTSDQFLTSNKLNGGPAAQPGRVLYNKSNGYSKWEIVSVGDYAAKNDKLSVKLLSTGINGSTPEFNSNDEIAIAKQCGVDGHVGGSDVNKRSDCDEVITWFANVPPQTPGTSIFRRQYVKAEITTPFIHQKLHYLRPGNGTSFPQEIVLVADSNPPKKSLQPQLTNFGPLGKNVIYIPGLGTGFDGLEFKRSTWYYIEEEFHAATFNGSTYNNDGSYRLWFGEAGKEPAQGAPTLELLAIPLPPITGGAGSHISFWGNVQHNSHARGSWYIDDVVISTNFNGAIPQSVTAKNIRPPEKVPVN